MRTMTTIFFFIRKAHLKRWACTTNRTRSLKIKTTYITPGTKFICVCSHVVWCFGHHVEITDTDLVNSLNGSSVLFEILLKSTNAIKWRERKWMLLLIYFFILRLFLFFIFMNIARNTWQKCGGDVTEGTAEVPL